jgi:hypothetical protein
MAKNKFGKPPQSAKAGRDIVQVGRDYTVGGNNRTINVWIPIVFLSVVTFGGLAWAVNAGLLAGSGNPKQLSTPIPSQAK